MRRIHLSILSILVLFAVAPASSQNSMDALVRGSIHEAEDLDQQTAEWIFASSDAAIYFPDLGTARWFELSGDQTSRSGLASVVGRTASLADFRNELGRDFPGFRRNSHGPYLLKLPSMGQSLAPIVEERSEAMAVAPRATTLTDSFESGLSQWQLADNTNGDYAFTVMGCETHTGDWSADAVRGGIRGQYLFCWDNYPASTITQITHSGCDGVQGASQAWLDFYLTADMADSEAIGVYYLGSDGYIWGYGFTGTWTGWFHVVLNLKQWYYVGDLTAQSCPRVLFQFRADSAGTSGAGPQIDDVTIRTDAPPFLTCSISATPASGPAPLTVSFLPTITGTTGGESFEWRFDDAAQTTSTARTATFTYTTPGDYYPRFRVIDANAARAYAHTQIQVTDAPACSMTCTATAPSGATAGSPASFQAAATPSGCSESPTFAWTFGDGQSSSQPNVSHSYGAAGTYAWTLTTKVNGVTCTKSGSIRVTAPTTRRRGRAVRRPAGDTTAIANATIGSSGGTLTGSGFTLTVPAGAFESTASLSLYKSTSAREEGDVSDAYIIDGLPERIVKDVTIEVERFSGAPPLGANQKYYLALDAQMYAKSKSADEADGAIACPIEASLAGNKVKATIPTTWPIPAASSATPIHRSGLDSPPSVQVDTRRCHVKAEERTRYETTHFYAFSVPSRAAAAQNILDMLEDHYQRLTDLGFSLACRVDATSGFRKIRVDPVALGTGDEAPLGYHVSGGDPCGTNWIFASDYLEITTSVPTIDTKVKAASAHELFHLVQDIYSPGGARANLWLKDASSVWFETTVGNTCPDVQNAYIMFTKRGLFNSQNSAVPAFWTTDREQRHGYGGSYALRYGVSSTGSPSFVYVLWENIRLGNGEIASFEAALAGSVTEFWRRFSKDYFYGRLSGGCSVSWSSFDRVAVSKPSSLPQSRAIAAYPLSSVSWSIDLQKFQSSDKVPTAIAAEGLQDGQSVFIYDVKAKSELGELTRAEPSYPIDDLTTMAGTVLVLVFVDTNLPSTGSANNQASTNQVTLKIGEQYARLSIGFTAYTFLCKTDNCEGVWCGVEPDDDPEFRSPLTWTGNSFRFEAGGWAFTGEMAADQQSLLWFKLGANEFTWMHWVNLPIDSTRSTPDMLVFAASGEKARDNVVVAYPLLCDSTHAGIDYTKKVQIEVWLAK